MVGMRTRHQNTPGHYEIDTDRSAITFRGRHLFGLAPVRGTVAIKAGTVDVADPIADSRVHAEIDVASFSTGNERRDEDVRSARFLDADRHPLMTFVSERLDDDALIGALTVRGVTKTVRLAIEESAMADGSVTVHATARVDRVAFGLTAARGLAGRHLNLDVRVIAHA